MISGIVGHVYKNYLPHNRRLERIWKIAQVDFKKRYYDDRLGLLWALLNPLSHIVLYYFVFTKIFQRSEENYALFLFSALIFWLAFAQATTVGQKLLVNKIHLIESIPFNWLDLYIAQMLSILLGLLFNVGAYLILLIILGVQIGVYFYLFPVILICWFLITMSCNILLGLIRPVFEDISHIWSLGLMIGFWVSGIFFSGAYFLDHYTWVAYVNPFIGLILNTRACLLEGNALYFDLLVINVFSAICLTILSIGLFKKYAKKAIEQL